MKKNIFNITGLIITVALMVCGIVGIIASAEDNTLKIENANVAYNDMMHLTFTLTGTDALPDGAEAGIIIWNKEQTEYTVENASYKTFDAKHNGSLTYYKSEGIAAPEIGATIHVAACYKLDGVVTVTETPFEYSIVNYLMNRLNKDITATQEELYSSILTYGAASASVITDNASPYLLVMANGGYIGEKDRTVAAAKDVGGTYTLRASETDAAGNNFVKWVDASGETVSEELSFTVTPDSLGLKIYTAVYDNSENSDYINAYSIDNLSTGASVTPTSESDATVSINAKNVAYEGAIQVLYAVEAQNVPLDGSVKMYFYDAEPTPDTAPTYVKVPHNNKITIDGVECLTFFSRGVFPKSMATPIYAKAVILDSMGTIVAESAVEKYSVYTYAINRLLNNPNDNQMILYTSMLDYGAAVQKMLLDSNQLTEQDIIDAGGWANAYCGIRQDVAYDGSVVSTGDVKFYTKGEVVNLSAVHSYGENGVFTSITDAKGRVHTANAYPKASVIAATPGVSTYTANYEITGYNFTTFDNLCVDGSANDVNILHKGKTGATAQSLFGTYAGHSTFGKDATAGSTAYQRVAADSANADNNVYLVGANGVAGNNTLSYTLDRVMENSDKYVIQFDLNYHGRSDAASGEPVWIRIQTRDLADKYDLRIIYLSDSSKSNTTYTIEGITLNKNHNYTLRFEITPISKAYYNFDMYVDGALVKSEKHACPKATNNGTTATSAINDIGAFYGVRFFNRSATDYSYELDNVYVGCEATKTGTGKYSKEDLTYTFDDANKVASDYTYESTPTCDLSDGYFNVSSSFAFKNSGTTAGTRFVYEMDFRFEAGTATTGTYDRNLGWFGLGGTSGSRSKSYEFAAFALPYSHKDGMVTSVTLTRFDGNKDAIMTMYPDTWYNIRIEYYNANTDTNKLGFIEVYVNGKLVTSYSAKGYNGSTTIPNSDFYCAAYEFRTAANSGANGMKFHFDNVYLGADNAVRGAGTFYDNLEYEGTRYDCETLDTVGFNNVNTSSTTLFEIKDGALVLVPNLSGSTQSSFGITNTEALAEGNVHVFETDIRITSGSKSNTTGNLNLGWFGMSSNRYSKNDFFVPYELKVALDENENISALKLVDHKKGGATVATLDAGKWYNLRLVYTAHNTVDDVGNVTTYSGTVEVFVNNVSVGSYTTVGYTEGDSDLEPNNVFTQAGFQFRTVNDSGIGWLEMQFDNIYLGTLNTAE